MSIALQYASLEKLEDLLIGAEFGPCRPVSGHDRLKHCSILPDVIGRHLLVEYCARDDLAHLTGARAQIQVAIDARMNVVYSRVEADDIAYGSLSVEKRFETLTSLPWLKESAEHVDRVAARTRSSRYEVSLVSNAIQRYALLNPGWELVSSWPHARHGLLN